MKDFSPVNFLSLLIPFVESSPFGIADIRVMPLRQPTMSQPWELNGISYGGISPPQTQRKATGDVEVITQANYYMQFIKSFVDEIQNLEITNTISQFEQWVFYENAREKQVRKSRRNPHFPRLEYPHELLSLSADGGSLILPQLDAQPPRAIYQVNLRIRFSTIFEMEEY